MLRVTFRTDSRNRLSSFSATGHAGWAEYGEDIVCAAASAILQAARLGLEDHAGVALEVEQHSGTLELRWPEGTRDDPAVQAIAATARLAIAQLAEQYPDHIACEARTEI
jgi:uncharacterized protein YsxB (DUF464 family)